MGRHNRCMVFDYDARRPCGMFATVQDEDGQWYCEQHSPIEPPVAAATAATDEPESTESESELPEIAENSPEMAESQDPPPDNGDADDVRSDLDIESLRQGAQDAAVGEWLRQNQPRLYSGIWIDKVRRGQ